MTRSPLSADDKNTLSALLLAAECLEEPPPDEAATTHRPSRREYFARLKAVFVETKSRETRGERYATHPPDTSQP
jgi:hypothetical protein